MRPLIVAVLLMYSLYSNAQSPKLTVEKIMQDPKWIGTSPSDPSWSIDGRYLFFSWNPDKQLSDSTYYITKEDPTPKKAPYSLVHETILAENVSYNVPRTAAVFTRDGDIFYYDVKTAREKRITKTVDRESDPQFSFHDTRIVYSRNQNLYSYDLASGLTEQLTNIQRSAAPPKEDKKESGATQEKWLIDDQLSHFDVLKSRKTKKDLADSINKSREPKSLKPIYIDDKMLNGLDISPDGRYITYRLIKRIEGHSTIVPSYVTESGFTRDIPGRTKVGTPQGSYTFFVFDTQKDTIIEVKTGEIPGITDKPDYVKDYPAKDTVKKTPLRGVIINGPNWSEQGTHAVVEVRAQDNKDRWLMLLDPATGKLKLLERQRDEAWIGGPASGGFGFAGGGNAGWIDENTLWYMNEEATGYSHLYKINVSTGEKTALTSGKYEVQRTVLSKDKKTFFITTNEVHPGEQQFYQLPAAGGKATRITTFTGSNQVTVSPDEKTLAVLSSYTNRPWELYTQPNQANAPSKQITNKAMTDEWKAYPWRDPVVMTFTARDGAQVYARLYRPANGTAPSNKPAVIFVHGAGYLQNAHKWWSSYYHEYMFNNLLADNGYTVMDIDYRGSAGYGRDWRTAIYRHMGGKDLDDQVDAAKWMIQHENVDPKRIGLYGGSYGGFITLMALFTQPDVFAAGGALRSVTDWAHYNHGYTASILNQPFDDSIAYRRSSPIYFADGLKGHLLMCHGMVDENVHFQDIVRLSQRLIELHKDNWELAVYPMEDHGFVEPSSWTDEYKRIFKLFETYLK